MIRIKILYADDEIRYRNLLKLFLEKQGYEVIVFPDGMALLDYVSEKCDADLIILDVMMPDMDGWETCREIKTRLDIPVLMLTALNDLKSEIYGIENGADDYISKPFSHDLFIARVKALLRRKEMRHESARRIDNIDLNKESCSIIINGTKSALTPKEFALLEYLISNKNTILSRDQILDNAWGINYDGDTRTVDTHIKSLRAKMGKAGAGIRTHRQKGYSYVGIGNEIN